MSDLKPIEPGCLCLIVNSTCGNEGISLTVLERAEAPPFWDKGQWWTTDTLIKFRCGQLRKMVREEQLMRIDGHDEQETENNKELELTE